MSVCALLLFAFLTGSNASACDVCGCGAGSYYFGIAPQFSKNFIGLRYRQQQFTSHPGSRVFQTAESFHSMELMGRWFPHRKWMLTASIPYAFQEQRDSEGLKTLNGMADMTFMANYLLFDWAGFDGLSVSRHTLALGAGLKLPTGSYRYSELDLTDVANPNFQLGTGSTDAVAALQYIFRHRSWGLWSDVSVKINSANPDGYRFGHMAAGNMSVFYVKEFAGMALMPSAGLYAETRKMDNGNGARVVETGGHLANATAGLNLFIGRFVLGAQFLKPVAQNLGQGHFRAEKQFMCNLGLVF